MKIRITNLKRTFNNYSRMPKAAMPGEEFTSNSPLFHPTSYALCLTEENRRGKGSNTPLTCPLLFIHSLGDTPYVISHIQPPDTHSRPNTKHGGSAAVMGLQIAPLFHDCHHLI